MTEENFKSGFVALIGRPNVGKSTFLNRVLGYKVSIVTEKVQTTRNKVTGIYTCEKGQIIFLDTPGLHVPRNKLGEYMVEIVLKALKEVDLILYIVEAENIIGSGDKNILRILEDAAAPIFLGINKIDKVSREELLGYISSWNSMRDFLHIVPFSAVSGENIERLLQELFNNLPPGPKYYPEDMITEQPIRQIIAENIREKAIKYTREEIPHSVAVSIDEINDKGNILEVYGVIITERESQKGIIIGKKGSVLREILRASRLELEVMLDTEIYLDIRVKVKKNWRKKEKILRDLGYV